MFEREVDDSNPVGDHLVFVLLYTSFNHYGTICVPKSGLETARFIDSTGCLKGLGKIINFFKFIIRAKPEIYLSEGNIQ